MDQDEEEWYLACYDEMHNHLLCEEPRVMPVSHKNIVKPIFETPHFHVYDTVKADNCDQLK